MYIWPDLSLQEIILALEADVTLYPAGMTLHLFTNDFTPTRASVMADFTELTNVEVPGYAATTPTWAGSPIRKNDGSWEDWTDQNQFLAAGGPPPTPVTVFGWYLANAGNTVVASSGRFDTPFTFTDDGDGFSLKARLNVNQTAGALTELIADMVMECPNRAASNEAGGPWFYSRSSVTLGLMPGRYPSPSPHRV